MPLTSEAPSSPHTLAVMGAIAEMRALGVWLETARAGDGHRFDPRAMTRALERAFIRLVTELAPTAILEVGAHRAEFSVQMKRLLPSATVVAIEANPEVHARHQRSLSVTGVDYRHLAVAARPGRLTLKVPVLQGKTKPTMGSLRSFGRAEEQICFEVEAQPLDQIAPPGRTALWIDVEGALDAVLAGAADTLARCDVAYLEVETRRAWPGQMIDVEVIDHCMRFGLVPVARDAQRPWQYNLVLVREGLVSSPAVQKLRNRLLQAPEPGTEMAPQVEPTA